MIESAKARSVLSRQSRAVASARAPGRNSGVSTSDTAENGSSSGARPFGGGHGARDSCPSTASSFRRMTVRSLMEFPLERAPCCRAARSYGKFVPLPAAMLAAFAPCPRPAARL